MVDTEAMIKAHPEMTKELRSAIKKLVNQYATDKSKPGNYHYKIVLAIKDYQSRLFDCY
jgi:hypothetical protein